MAEARVNPKTINPKTRQISSCPVFGAPAKMPQSVLPTLESMMKFYLFTHDKMKPDASSKEPSVAEIAEEVALEVEGLWIKASIPHISHKRVTEKIRMFHDKYRNLLKSFKNRQNDPKYKAKLKDFLRETKTQLFDIAACKCPYTNLCQCEKDKKVPVDERIFLFDQRTSRAMMI